jgi:hypothetical protein
MPKLFYSNRSERIFRFTTFAWGKWRNIGPGRVANVDYSCCHAVHVKISPIMPIALKNLTFHLPPLRRFRKHSSGLSQMKFCRQCGRQTTKLPAWAGRRWSALQLSHQSALVTPACRGGTRHECRKRRSAPGARVVTLLGEEQPVSVLASPLLRCAHASVPTMPRSASTWQRREISSGYGARPWQVRLHRPDPAPSPACRENRCSQD